MNLPRSVQQHRVSLGQSVSAGRLTVDEAGRALADFLTEKFPALARGILVNWCTARFRKYNPLPEGWVQTGLWPVTLWGKTLAEARDYADQQAEMTARFSIRDQKRAADLDVLEAAAGGNLAITLDEAYRLAYPDDEAAVGQ